MAETIGFEPNQSNPESKENQGKYIILEIGSRDASVLHYADHVRQKIKNNPDAQYVAMDLKDEESALQSDRDRIQERMEDIKDRVHHIIADGGELPFADASVNEIIVRDVLGAPYVNPSSALSIIEESVRVLKSGGQLKIFECASPRFALRYLRFIEENLSDTLKVVEHKKFDQNAHQEMINNHRLKIATDGDFFDMLSSAQGDFMIIFKKIGSAEE